MFNYIIGIAFLIVMLIPIAILFLAFISKVREDIIRAKGVRKQRAVYEQKAFSVNDKLEEEYASRKIRIVK